MREVVEAYYEDGMLRLDHPLSQVRERSRVRVIVESNNPTPSPLSGCIGIMPAEDAEEMKSIIDAEFERVDPREWQ